MRAIYPIAHSAFRHLLPAGRMRVVDAGASGGGEYARWKQLNERLELHAFEPDIEECEHQRKVAENSEGVINYYTDCLGKSMSNRPLYFSREPGNASFLELDMDWYARKAVYRDGHKIRQSELFEVIETRYVDSISLDDWAKQRQIDDLDYLKVDIEGVELELLTESPRILGKLVGVSVDVIFHRDWKGAAVFAEVDEFMRAHGFGLMELRSLGRNYQFETPVRMMTMQGEPVGQVACADALYLRDPLQFDQPQLSRDKLVKLAIAAEVNWHADYAFEMLSFLLRNESDPKYRETLQQVIDDCANAHRALIEERRGLRLTAPVEHLCRAIFPESWWDVFRPFAHFSRRSAGRLVRMIKQS